MKTNKKTKKLSVTGSLPLIKRLCRDYIIPQKALIFWGLVLMLISSAMTGLMAKMMEPIIDKVFTAGNESLIWPMAGAIFAVFVVRGFAVYGQIIFMTKVGQGIVSDMQRDMFSHLVHADTNFFHNQQTGTLLSRFVLDMDLIRGTVIESMSGIGKNTFTLIFLMIVMFMQDAKLSLISLLAFPTAAYAVAILSKKLRRFSNTVQEETGILTSTLNQAFQGSKHIKSYVMENFEKERINTTILKIYKVYNKAFRLSALTSPVAEILSGLAIVAIIVYGGMEIIAGNSTPGKLLSFITAFILAYEPMKRLARLNNKMQMGLAALDRMYILLDDYPKIIDKPNATDLEISTPVVSFNDVSFTYADGTDALKGVSFTANAHETIALVGESGAGKSTILNLLPRFYDIDTGTITIDGTNIQDVTLKSLRKSMALVSQEVAIFNDSILDNIRYGTLEATEEQVIEAAKQAAAHEFIEQLPDGYQTIVGENGVKLSGGQRQRISIARAILKRAPILLLDEATSALDANSERLVQSALENLQKNCTTIVVAHRLSTIMNADMIYVLDDGRVIENGKHADLIAQQGVYSRLYGNMIEETV